MAQFAESDECVFLVEASIKCAKVAAYTFLNVKKEIPKVWEGISDLKGMARMIRALHT
jgi:myosin-crossreactive antigen